MKIYSQIKPLTVIVFLLVFSICFGQNQGDSVKYNLAHILAIQKAYGNWDSTATTKFIITEISAEYELEYEQKQLLNFCLRAYNYKIIDKVLIKHVVDSLTENGLSEEIRSIAIDAQYRIEYNIFNKKIGELKYADKNGDTLALSSFKDKIVIIEIWATWCGQCVKEMRRIPELRKVNPNIEFYSICVGDSLPRMKQFLVKNDYDWPIVFGDSRAKNQKLSNYFNVLAIPMYLVVDRNWNIIRVSSRLDDEFMKSLK